VVEPGTSVLLAGEVVGPEPVVAGAVDEVAGCPPPLQAARATNARHTPTVRPLRRVRECEVVAE
jgi:hypothetical protein